MSTTSSGVSVSLVVGNHGASGIWLLESHPKHPKQWFDVLGCQQSATQMLQVHSEYLHVITEYSNPRSHPLILFLPLVPPSSSHASFLLLAVDALLERPLGASLLTLMAGSISGWELGASSSSEPLSGSSLMAKR